MTTLQTMYGDIKQLVSDVESSLKQLGDVLGQTYLQAVYWDRQGQKHQMDAPEKVIHHLQHLSFPEKDSALLGNALKRPSYGAIGVSIDVSPYVNRVNKAKKAFQQYHEQYVAQHDQKEKAQADIRQAVMTAGIDVPSIKAIDRQITYIPGVVSTMQWHEVLARKSRSRPIQDLINELERLGEKFQSQHGAIGHYLDLCRQLPPDTRVYHKSSKPSARLECTVMFQDQLDKGNTDRQTMNVYAANPIIFYQSTGLTPLFFGLGEGPSREGAGRRSTIQDHPIDEKILPNWFFYKQSPKANKKRAKTTRRKNPYSETAFPGLWLGVKKRKTGKAAFVQVGAGDVSSSFSINRHGLEKAWSMASELYAGATDRQVSEILKVIPDKEQVDNLLDWQSEEKG